VCEGKGLTIEGLYRKNHRLYRFENVILTVKGIGIIGILPFALQFAIRKRYNDSVCTIKAREMNLDEPIFRDITRYVVLYWWLENNLQED